jgi:hypothetical protein
MSFEKAFSILIISFIFYSGVWSCHSLPYKDRRNDYTHIGCFKDNWPPTIIPLIEGNQNVSQILDDHYRRRKNPIYKCYLATKHLRYRVFGVNNNGLCVTSEDALFNYHKLGQTTDCNSEGTGGTMAIDVYEKMINK